MEEQDTLESVALEEREYLEQCNEKQKELESSAKDLEWLWLRLLFTSRKQYLHALLDDSRLNAVFAMVSFHRWVWKSSGKKLSFVG